MGNTSTTSKMSNHSKRNLRIFVTKKALEIDSFIASHPDDGEDVLPKVKKFTFRKDINYIRVLASQSQEILWEEHQFVSIFAEDEDDENICYKQITQNKALTAPVSVLLYDV